jgi:hypothetical protein
MRERVMSGKSTANALSSRCPASSGWMFADSVDSWFMPAAGLSGEVKSG